MSCRSAALTMSGSMTGALTLAADATVLRVDTGSFLAIVATAAVAGTLAAVAGGRGLFIPVVVLELVLGVVIGPQVLGLAQVNEFTEFFSDLGLGMLFFFAGYEIDIARIRGRAAAARAARLGDVARDRLHARRRARRGRRRRLARLRRLGAGDHRDRDADPGALGHRRAATPSSAPTCSRRARSGEFGPILLLTLVLSTQSAVTTR